MNGHVHFNLKTDHFITSGIADFSPQNCRIIIPKTILQGEGAELELFYHEGDSEECELNKAGWFKPEEVDRPLPDYGWMLDLIAR